MTSLREKASIHQLWRPGSIQDEFDETSLFDRAPGPKAKPWQCARLCLQDLLQIYDTESIYRYAHTHIYYIYTILLNITELVLLFTICLPLCSHIFPVKSYMFNVGGLWLEKPAGRCGCRSWQLQHSATRFAFNYLDYHTYPYDIYIYDYSNYTVYMICIILYICMYITDTFKMWYPHIFLHVNMKM